MFLGGKKEQPIRSGNADQLPMLDYTSIGVGNNEIRKWKAAKERLELINTWKFPRAESIVEFFRGESDTENVNSVNNPLQLIRPKTLTSLSSILYYNGDTYNYPKYYAQAKEERGVNDEKSEQGYLGAVKAFERVATAVLESLNETNPDKRKDCVKRELSYAFGTANPELPYISYDVRKVSARETPQEWLVYSVLSVLNNPSEEITPVGRLRALELLEIYPNQELVAGFRGTRGNINYHNGYDQKHTPRIPYTFCSRDERLQSTHKDQWGKNERISRLLVKGSNQKVDWKATAALITETAPEEAVQLAMLFLHDASLSEGALAYLRSMPNLDSSTKTRMFGSKATFLLEPKIGQSPDDLIAEGTGLVPSPGDSLEDGLDRLSAQDLLMLLRRSRRVSSELEEELVEAEVARSALAWEIAALKETNLRWRKEADFWHTEALGMATDLQQMRAINASTNERLQQMRATNASINERLRYWQTRAQQLSETTGAIADKLDPLGYFRILGLHPQAFENLSEEKIQELISRHFRFYAVIFHPDHQGDEEKMKKLNDANDVLKDPKKRKLYGKR